MFHILDQDSLIPLPIESETFIQRQAVIHFLRIWEGVLVQMSGLMLVTVLAFNTSFLRVELEFYVQSLLSRMTIEIIKTFQIAGPSSVEIAAIVSKLN